MADKEMPEYITENHLKWQMNEIVGNLVSSRSRWIQQSFDRRRNIDDECGYKTPAELTVDDYQDMYDREGIASRVVHCLPEESWKLLPQVYETDDTEEETAFEKSWKDLAKTLQGEDSLFDPEEDSGHPMFEYLERVDIVSGIGCYGVLLLGVDDGLELSEPVKKKKNMKLLYVRCFPQKLAEVCTWENDTGDPRYGKPTAYNLSFHDPSGSTVTTYEPIRSQKVHWTRVIHVADNLESSEIYGVPRMRPVWNRLYDLRKLYGGSAEMYWQGAFPGLSFETHPQLGPDVEIPADELKEVVEEYRNGLQRFLAISGVSAKTLAPQVVDPTPQIDTQLEAICIRLAIPKRIFMGSERGELSSSQDKDTWNGQLKHRWRRYSGPRLIVPVINWLLRYGILEMPAEAYKLKWPKLDELSPVEEATVLVQRTDALVKYVGGDVAQILEPTSFFSLEMKYTDDEIEQINAATEEYIEDKEEEEALEREADLEQAKELGLEAGSFATKGEAGPSFQKPEPEPEPPQPKVTGGK